MVTVALIQAFSFPFSFRLEITKFNFDEVISVGACRQSNSLLFLSESLFFSFHLPKIFIILWNWNIDNSICFVSFSETCFVSFSETVDKGKKNQYYLRKWEMRQRFLLFFTYAQWRNLCHWNCLEKVAQATNKCQMWA